MLRTLLLGRLEVERDGVLVESVPSHRPWALFAYLALAGRPVSRAELIRTFWPDVLDRSARASLRSAVWTLRRALGDAVVAEGDTVMLAADAWIDVREFERLAGEDPGAAVALCRGELLEGLEDDWANTARERHRELVVGLLEQLACAAADPAQALELTRQQVQHAPFDEPAHRRLIGRLAAAGDRPGALRAYQRLAERLRNELGVAPSRETRELVERATREAPAIADLRPAPARAPRGMLPLHGRDGELAALKEVWAAAVAGDGAAASIRGEAGIGKSRLASELGGYVAGSGALVAAGAGLELGGSAPLGLWSELLRDLLPALPAPPREESWPDDLALLVGQLPEQFATRGRPAPAVAPDLQRTRLFEAVVTVLGWASRQAPLLIVLEDIQDADAPSLALAAYAARRLAGMRVMLLLTRREPPPSPDADRLELALRARGVLRCELELAPLTSAAGAALVTGAAQAASVGPLSSAEVELAVERAEGNPLLLIETARALARGQELAPSLRGIARAALAPAEKEVRRLIELAAVAARPLELDELSVLGLADPEQAAESAIEGGLLVGSGGRIAFRHALLRDGVYAEIAEPRARGLHLAWAQALLDAEQASGLAKPAEVARHLRLAGADRRAVPQLARAAGEARAVAALDEAAGYLEEALTIAADDAALWLELGEVEAWRARREAAEGAFERALALLAGADPLHRARAQLRLARAFHGPICVPRVVLASAREALELIEQPARREADAPAGHEHDEERSEAIAAWAWAEAVAGSVEEAERLLAKLSRLPAGPAPQLRTYDAGHARALALMRRGRFAEAYAPSIAAGEAIAAAGRPDLAYGCWANAASAACAAGEPERALEFIDRGSEAIAGHGLQSLEIQLAAARSFVLRRLGRLEQAAQAAATERALAERLGERELVAMADNDLGLTALAAGDLEEAITRLRACLKQPAPISRPLARLALAEALAASGDPDGAAEQVRETVFEPLRPSDFPQALVPRLARAQGLTALARGEYHEARRRIDEAIASWRRLVAGGIREDSITTVLADLGRPVVGLVEPEHELAQAELDLILINQGDPDAVVP